MGSQGNGLDWATEPIAIIGMSCKFGGDATSPEKLWEMVSKGGSAWSEIPSSRFNWKGSYHPDSERRGTVCEPDDDPSLDEDSSYLLTTCRPTSLEAILWKKISAFSMPPSSTTQQKLPL